MSPTISNGRRWTARKNLESHRSPTCTLIECLWPAQRATLTGQSDALGTESLLIVSRGLAHPEPWAVRYSTIKHLDLPRDNNPLSELLSFPPDEFITTVMVVYRLPQVLNSVETKKNVSSRARGLLVPPSQRNGVVRGQPAFLTIKQASAGPRPCE